MHYFSSPGLSWDALLKKMEVELELLRDQVINLLIERGIRDSIFIFIFAKASNALVEVCDTSKT